MSNVDVELLYGVSGGGDLSGASGQEISKSLNKLVKALEKAKVPTIKLFFDEKDFTSKLKAIKERITKELGGAFNININNINTSKTHKGNNAPSGVNETKTYLNLKQQISDAYKAQAEFAQSAVGSNEEIEKSLEDVLTKIDTWKKLTEEQRAALRNYASELKSQNEANLARTQQDNYNRLQQSIKQVDMQQREFYRTKQSESEHYKNLLDSEVNGTNRLKSEIESTALTEQQRAALLDKVNATQVKNQAALGTSIENAKNSYAKISNKVNDYIQRMEKQGLATKEAREQLEALKALLRTPLRLTSDNDAANLKEYKEATQALNSEYSRVSTEISKSGASDPTALGNFIKALQNKFQSMLSGMLIASAGRAIMQVYNNVVKLDKAVTNLQIATGVTREETEKLIGTYSDLARELGATTLEVADAADTWLRQGYSIAETNELIKNTMMLSKLGQLDSAEAARALTSAMKGYKMEVEDVMSIVDKFTSVDMKAAIGAGDIATAMAETAASADVAGVSMNNLIGYIATVGEITQDGAESVGTFFKTMFARMGNVKAGVFTDDATGESLNDVERVLHKVGIELRNDKGLFRDFSDVLDEVGSQWEEYDNIQKHAIATAFAGTRQQEKFIVLMENYATAMEYAGVAADSAGTAQEKYQSAYADSIEAKLNRLTATWQSFSASLLDSDIIKTGVDFLAGIASWLDKIVQFGDGILVIVPLITVALLTMHAALVKIKATQTFSAMWAGLKGVLAIFPAIIASMKAMILNIRAQAVAHKGAAASIAAQTAATNAQAAANTAMNATNPVGWIILGVVAIYAIVKAIQKYKSAIDKAKEASRKADEEAAERLEQAEKTKEQTKELIDLIEQYKEAIEGVDDVNQLSAEARQEVLAIQEAIVKAVGHEADGIDLVNDGLDESLKKLKQLKYEQAETDYEDSLAAYYSAQNSSNKAYETSYVNLDGITWGLKDLYQMTFERGKDASKYAKEISKIIDSVSGVEVNADATIGDKFYGVNFNFSDAQEAVDSLNYIIDEIVNRGYAEGSSDIYNQLVGMRNKYQARLDKENDALNGFVDAVVGLNAWEMDNKGIVIETLADYDAFRNSIIEAVQNDEYIKKSDAALNDIITSVDDWLSLYYADWFNKKAKQYKPQTVTLKSFIDIFEELEGEYDALSDAMKDMDKQGVISGQTISNLADKYPELMEYLEETGDLVQDSEGYKLAADSLDNYLEHMRSGYVQTLQDMKDKRDAIADALARGEEGVTEEQLSKAETSVSTAEKNLANFESVVNTILKPDLLEKYNEQLEKQSEVLDGQLEKFKDIVSVRQDLLKTYKKELDYQKELASKQKSVADLQTKLKLAQLDTSASGQARVRELESELEDAQEDLNELTLEKAIEQLTAELEAESIEYEEFIQLQIESINEAIAEAAKMTVDALSSLQSGDKVESHHTGGFVMGAKLKDNEEFAKLLQGEFVATPGQMSRFMNKTLPSMTNQNGGNIVYNSPLIEIKCDSVDSETLPKLQKVIDKAVKKVKAEIDDAFRRTGRKGNIDKFTI